MIIEHLIVAYTLLRLARPFHRTQARWRETVSVARIIRGLVPPKRYPSRRCLYSRPGNNGG